MESNYRQCHEFTHHFYEFANNISHCSPNGSDTFWTVECWATLLSSIVISLPHSGFFRIVSNYVLNSQMLKRSDIEHLEGIRCATRSSRKEQGVFPTRRQWTRIFTYKSKQACSLSRSRIECADEINVSLCGWEKVNLFLRFFSAFIGCSLEHRIYE